jgi:hypothetical protein
MSELNRSFVKTDLPWCYSLFEKEYAECIGSLKSPKSLEVRRVENSFANEWVLRHHYLKRKVYIARNVSYGIFSGDFCFGVIIFGYPVWTTYKGIVPPFSPGEVPELLRLSTVRGLPKNTESFFCSQSFKKMKVDWKTETGYNLKVITSLCDLQQGFNGALYKALNFVEHSRGKIGRPSNPGGSHGKWRKNDYKEKPEKIMFVLRFVKENKERIGQ